MLAHCRNFEVGMISRLLRKKDRPWPSGDRRPLYAFTTLFYWLKVLCDTEGDSSIALFSFETGCDECVIGICVPIPYMPS